MFPNIQSPAREVRAVGDGNLLHVRCYLSKISTGMGWSALCCAVSVQSVQSVHGDYKALNEKHGTYCIYDTTNVDI